MKRWPRGSAQVLFRIAKEDFLSQVLIVQCAFLALHIYQNSYNSTVIISLGPSKNP